MLKHEDNPQTQPSSAAQVRVTPEELAAAITALQIRKEGQPGTIAIGDAVEELGLDATPEEVLAEVEARRQVPKPKSRRDYWALACAIACIVPLAFGTFSNSSMHSNIPTMRAPALTQAKILDGIGNGQQVYVDTHGLKEIIEGVPEAKVQVYADNVGVRWGLIKHDGKVYVQAYALEQSEKSLTSKPVNLVNSEDHYGPSGAGFNDGGTLYPVVKVTLPIAGFQYEDSQQTSEHAQITVSEVHTNSHLWDGFTDRFTQ